jgi:hypothetical protein
MLSMPFAEDEAAKVATRARSAIEAEDGEDGDRATAGSSEDAGYAFEGFQIESSERISLTPMGVPAAHHPRPRS